MVEIGTGTAASRFLKTKYPVEEGLTAGTQTQEGRISSLESDNSIVTDNDKDGVR